MNSRKRLRDLRTQVPWDAGAIAKAQDDRYRELAEAAGLDSETYRAEVVRAVERATALRDRLEAHVCPLYSCPAVGTILRVNAAAESDTVVDHALLHSSLDRAETHVWNS